MQHGIDFGFLKGARMKDKYGLLTGNGKVMRVLPLKSFDKETVSGHPNICASTIFLHLE